MTARRWTIMRLPAEAVALLNERRAWMRAFLAAFMRHATRKPRD